MGLGTYRYAVIIAFQLLTRLPLATVDILAPEQLQRETGRSLLFYPFVGLVIGLMLFAVAIILPTSWLAAALILTVWVALTGALHIDGLADSADAWMGGFGNKERTLEIMKDPRSGPIGVVAVVLLLMLKVIAIEMLLRADVAWALIIVPMVARTWVLLLFLQTPYVRPKGLGEILVKAMPSNALWNLTGVLFIAVLFVPAGIPLMLVVSLVAGWMRRLMMARIDGFSGDTAGAGIEVIEVVSLIVLALSLSSL